MVEPQGQGSFLPIFSDNSLSLWTTLWPRFTFVSEGYPFLRLLMVSKKEVAAIICVFSIHDDSPICYIKNKPEKNFSGLNY